MPKKFNKLDKSDKLIKKGSNLHISSNLTEHFNQLFLFHFYNTCDDIVRPSWQLTGITVKGIALPAQQEAVTGSLSYAAKFHKN